MSGREINERGDKKNSKVKGVQTCSRIGERK